MADHTPTLVPLSMRSRMAGDPELGGGNVLSYALESSAAPDAPYLIAETPVRYVDERPKTEFSLAEVDLLARAWSAHYLRRGVGPRDRVAVYLRDSFEDLLHFFALSRIGAIPVLVNGRMPAELAAAHCRRTGVVGIHTDAEHRRGLSELMASAGPWTQTCVEVDLTAPVARTTYQHADADPILICHSSGTTGVPKPVVWTHGQTMVGIRGHLRGFRDSPRPVILSALPQSHGAAVGYLALAMLTGTPVVLLTDNTAANVALAIETHRATTVAAFAGTYADLAELPAAEGRFDTVEGWVSVGDSAHQSHISRLVRHGRHWEAGRPVPGSMFIDGLGSSELGWGGVLSRITVPGTTHPDRCIGVAQPHARVTVLREDGTEAAPGEVGSLAVRSESVTPGYWNDSDTTFRSMLAGHWLSGDLAYRDEHGRFYHVDRAVDAIRTPGGPGYSVLMEETVMASIPELVDCAVVAGRVDGEIRPVAVVKTRDPAVDEELLLRKANDALRDAGQPELAFLEITESFPVGPTGKVLKRQLRQRFDAAA